MTASSGWGAPPADAKAAAERAAAEDAARIAKDEQAAAEYAKSLVKMTRTLPEGETGVTEADVHETQVSEWEQAGWRKA